MRCGITITVRMKSQRLPGKATRELGGTTLIEQMIQRLKHARLPDEIVLCTSENPQDDILVDLAKKSGIGYFRGDGIDVLKRLLDAARKYRLDFIVSTTGDNPLTDPEYIDRIITKFKETDADYITCLDLPIGTFSYGLKVSALEDVIGLKKEDDTEIWGGYFAESNRFKKEKLEVEEALRQPGIRLTVDTPEDYELMKAIFKRLYREGDFFSTLEVIKLLKNEPELGRINRDIVQRGMPKIDLSNFEKHDEMSNRDRG